MVSKGTSEANLRKERILSGAALKVRNNKLAAKQEVISNVFEMSLNELKKLTGEDFKNFVKSAILNSKISGDEKLILNEEGKKIIDQKFVDEINKEIGKATLTISEETRSFSGGFILEKNGIEMNNTYEALLNSLRDELEFEVASVLFN